MDKIILKLDNAKKGYGTNIVLNGINLDIYSGEILGIIGPSGSGKSTLLMSMIGFLPLDEGDVLFRDDRPALGDESLVSVFKHPGQIKKLVGFAAQMPAFYNKLTVSENLDYFGTLYGLSHAAIKANSKTLLELMDLEKSSNIAAMNLSGGMQRRLDIACALIHDPRILILDEPTSDLDPVLSQHIWDIIRRVNRAGKTIILASHHLSDVENICNRIAILFNGRLAEVGTISEIVSKMSGPQELHIETFPGNYDKIIKIVDDKQIIRKENRGHCLIIQTKKPEEVLLKIMHQLKGANEILMDVKITRLTLDDVFSKLTRKEK